jgi:SNF2 family DNA or RNA helicase
MSIAETRQTASFWHTANEILIRVGFEHVERCRSLRSTGARWDHVHRVWTLAKTPACAAAIIDRFDGVVTIPDGLRNLAAAVTGPSHREFLSPVAPWAHQLEAFAFALGRDGALLAMGLGTGKSKVAIGLCEAWGVRRVLIICPAAVLRVWPKEFQVHAEQRWQTENGLQENRRGRLVPVPVKTRVEQASAALESSGPVAVAANYEVVYREPMRSLLLCTPWGAIIWDEAQRLKSAGSKSSLFARELLPHARRRLGLSGTPLSESPLDIYAVGRALDPGVFGQSRRRFLDEFAESEEIELGDGQVISRPLGLRPDAEPEFTRRLAELAYFCPPDVLDLPPALDLPPRYCTLSPRAQRVHDRVERDMWRAAKRGENAAALTFLTRSTQIAGGHDGDGSQIDHGKERLLRETLEELGGRRAVVFSRFVAELDVIERVCADLGLRYGEVSGADKGGLSAAGRMAESIDVLGAQIHAGSAGIDLTRASVAIFYSPGLSLTDYEQARARVHRPGQSEPIAYVHLVCEGTLDEQVYELLRAKRDVIAAVIGDARKLQRGECG